MSLWQGQSKQAYEVPEVRDLLAHTNGGESFWLWAAEYDDGTVISQFDTDTMNQMLLDPLTVPSVNLGKSVNVLDVSRVKELILYPSAHARSVCSWLSPIRLVVNLKKGEKFISFRLQSRTVILNGTQEIGALRICRFVVGIVQHINGAAVKTFTIISPSGLVTVASSDDQSYEGE